MPFRFTVMLACATGSLVAAAALPLPSKNFHLVPTPWQKALRWPIIFLVRLYQSLLSPLLPGSCRHVPTCSQYTLEAIEEWGALQGSWMGLKRLSRCHPWGKHGYDPVPKKNSQTPNSP